MQIRRPSTHHRFLSGAAVVSALAAATPASAAPTISSVVRTYGQAAVSAGYAPGVEIAVVHGAAKPAFYSFGVTTPGGTEKPTPATLFQIASVTKVFTTNLLGQAASAGTMPLTQTLSSFTATLGDLPENTANISLQELADFTGGLPTLAPLCRQNELPSQTGCLPNSVRPDIHDYTGRDFAAFFRTYQTSGAPPHDYLYSDYSLGLVGLLLGAEPGAKLTNQALAGWERLLHDQLLVPLGMRSTFVRIPPEKQSRLAPGYAQALATANVSTNGGVASLNLQAGGSYYSTAPSVTISGGGGTGASYTAQITNGSVSGFTMVNAGSFYIAPPQVTFSTGNAFGTAIVKNGRITGVLMKSNGNYTAVPTVTFSGGRIGGHDAQGTVFVDHDQAAYVQITDPGAGYVDPLTVTVAPGAPAELPVPIWAPAGALKSSARDLATFAAAALGHTTIGTLAVPASITNGFAVAETPYACESGAPTLNGCTSPQTGLAWDIHVTNPRTISKDGGLPGYSTVVLLLPQQDTAIVVLMNSYQGSGFAPTLGADIAAALYHDGLLGVSH